MGEQVVTLEQIRESVGEKYAAAARQASLCCGNSSSCCADAITGNLYDSTEAGLVPDAAMAASLGCGNPTALAELKPGEVVLDLGSGGGIDVLLSARRVGPTGYAYGLDMTDEMLALAEQNKAESGLENVTFLRGHIEAIPLPANTVDVIISNCVINLSGDKPTTINEAYRVLKPGGRFAVSDVVVRGELPPSVRKSMVAWVGCIAGALREDDFRGYLEGAGFTDVSFEVTRVYDPGDIEEIVAEGEAAVQAARESGEVVSAFIRAHKPA